MNWKVGFFLMFLAVLLACAKEKHQTEEVNMGLEFKTYSEVKEFIKDASIYEVNIRQYTPEGTFKAFSTHLDRLEEMGVKIIWLMPLHPIGAEKRKGGLGSYYSIRDYRGINPEFGTADDFRRLVKEIHSRDMMVLMDWVANHTAWDHRWVKKHPEFYMKDSLGEIIAPVEDWSDVAGLNYEKLDLRDSMIQCMQYWVEQYNIDGYRCDVAGMVPTDFWEQARDSLNAIRPVFMLAEAEKLELHRSAFEMGYAWELHHIMNMVAKREFALDSITHYFQRQKERYPDTVIRMNFTSNHDENTWKGNAVDRFGKDYENMIALSFTVPGMPLIYGGQEAGLKKDLRFFEKDTIQWKNSVYDTLFRQLLQLKYENKCLWNGSAGGKMTFLPVRENDFLAYKRSSETSELIVLLNFSEVPVIFDWESADLSKENYYAFKENKDAAGERPVKPHGFDIFIKK